MNQTVHHLNAQTRNEVWREIYNSEFAFRYYQALSNIFLKKQKRLSLTSKFLGGITTIPAVLQLQAVASNADAAALIPLCLGVLGAAVAIVSEVSDRMDYASKSSVCAAISKSCGMLKQDFADLLAKLDQRSISDAEARRELKMLIRSKAQETDASEMAGIVLPNPNDNDKVLDQATNDAHKHMEASYVT